MSFNPTALLHMALSAVLFSLLGISFFGLAFWLMSKLAPFSIRKEIESDHNVALAIVMGSVILSLGMIVSAALIG